MSVPECQGSHCFHSVLYWDWEKEEDVVYEECCTCDYRMDD